MSGTASVPGWWVEFASAVFRQLPRPGEISQATAERWCKDQRGLKDVLAHTLLPPKPSGKWTLYRHPSQAVGDSVVGFYLETHLKETGLIERAYSLEDELVKGWLSNPATYPAELRGEVIFLWQNTEGEDDDGTRTVPCLVWDVGMVHVRRYSLFERLGNDHRALLTV